MKGVHLYEAVGAASAVVIVVLLAAIWRRRPRSLKVDYFQNKWQKAQKMCASKETWPQAIMLADALLDEALKRRRFKGKSMGERLVAAQHSLTENDSVWFGHKLCNRIKQDEAKPSKRDVKNALVGFRQALRDIGALE